MNSQQGVSMSSEIKMSKMYFSFETISLRYDVTPVQIMAAIWSRDISRSINMADS